MALLEFNNLLPYEKKTLTYTNTYELRLVYARKIAEQRVIIYFKSFFILMLISPGILYRCATENSRNKNYPFQPLILNYFWCTNILTQRISKSSSMTRCFSSLFHQEFKTTTNEQFSPIEGGIPEGPRQSGVRAKSDNTWQAGRRAVIWLIIPD